MFFRAWRQLHFFPSRLAPVAYFTSSLDWFIAFFSLFLITRRANFSFGLSIPIKKTFYAIALTCIAWRKAGGSVDKSAFMLAQCEVPGIKMATSSVDVWFTRTLNACQGSIDPVQIIRKIDYLLYLKQLFTILYYPASFYSLVFSFLSLPLLFFNIMLRSFNLIFSSSFQYVYLYKKLFEICVLVELALRNRLYSK